MPLSATAQEKPKTETSKTEKSQTTNLPAISAQDRDYFGRVLLNNTTTPPFNLVQVGTSLQINFDAPLEVDTKTITALQQTMSGYARSFQLSKDRTKLSITLARPNLSSRSFEGVGVRGIDIIDPIKRSQKRSVPPTNIVEKTPEKPINNTISTVPATATPAAEPANESKEFLTTTPQDAMSAADRNTMFPAANALTVERDNMAQGIRLLLPWKENRAAAIFARQNRVYAVFDTPRLLNFDKLRNLRFIQRVQQIFIPNYTILVLTMDDNVELLDTQKKATKSTKTPLELLSYKQEQAWVIHFNIPRKTQTAKESSHLSIPFDSGLEDQKQYLWMDVRRTAEPVRIIDDRIGDTLVVVPVAEENAFISPTRNFVDFSLLETAQGIAITPISDVLEYKVMPDGVRISSRDNLNITQNLYEKRPLEETTPEAIAAPEPSTIPSNTVFPFKAEGIVTHDDDKEQSYIQHLESLYRALTKAPPEEKSDARFDIAKFYFGESMCPEALGVLRDLYLVDPAYPKILDAKLIEAACLYLGGHYEEANTGFNALREPFENHPNHDEISFWRWASSTQNNREKRLPNDQDIPYDYVQMYDKFMMQYPARLRYHFGLLAVEDLLNKDEIEKAGSTLEIISYDNVPSELVNDTEFLRAQIAVRHGDYQDAVERWTALSEDIDDRYNRARAMFELTKYQLVTNQIPVDEAVKRFDLVSVMWRGDKLELDVLKLAGQLYINDKRYYEGLRAWQALVNNFPNTKESLFIAGRMKNAFTHFFESGLAYTVSPFQALAMYFDFQELTPVGKRGDQIIQQLADHFVGADLIDNALNLLDHQLRFRVGGQARNQLVLKMSELYLINKNPEKAIAVLQNIDEAAAPKETIAQSRRAEAKARMAMNDFTQARTLLADDFSPEAQDIRLNMFWQEQNWFGIMHLVEPRIPSFNGTPGFPLKQHEIADLLKLAVAYNAQQEKEKLAQLNQLFTTRVSDKKSHDMFQFLTTAITPIDFEALNASTQEEAITSFITGFSVWPQKNWPKIVETLEPYVKTLKREYPPLNVAEKQDVVRLAIAYAMQDDIRPAQVKLKGLMRDYPGVAMDGSTIGVMDVFDDRLNPKAYDVPFTGSILLENLGDFIKKYQAAETISALNTALSGGVSPETSAANAEQAVNPDAAPADTIPSAAETSPPQKP